MKLNHGVDWATVITVAIAVVLGVLVMVALMY